MDSIQHNNIFQTSSIYGVVFFPKLILTLLLWLFARQPLSSQLCDIAAKIKIKVGPDGKESWSAEWSLGRGSRYKVGREAGEGGASSMGKGWIALGAGTVQGRRRYKKTATEEGGAGLQKPWQVGLHVHESKHLQGFIKNPRKDCWLKSRYLSPNHLTFKRDGNKRRRTIKQ